MQVLPGDLIESFRPRVLQTHFSLETENPFTLIFPRTTLQPVNLPLADTNQVHPDESKYR